MVKGLICREVIFFGGKGGVGKTTCAAAYSLLLSRKGYRTLVVSTDPAHSLGDIFGVTIGSGVKELKENLYGLEIDPEKESKKYVDRIREQLKKSFSQVIIEDIQRQLDAAYHSPGAEEAAIFDKFIETVDLVGKEYDRVVFDTAPTGHTLRLLSLPELMEAWLEGMIERRKKVNNLVCMASASDKSLAERVKDDPVLEILYRRKEGFQKARTFLLAQGRAGFVFVLNPERLPIVETEKAISFLKRYGIPVEGVIVNRILPEDIESEFFRKRKEVEARFMKEIEEKFRGRILARIPLMEEDISGYESIERVTGFLK